MKGWGKREIPEKTSRPTASSGPVATCENPVTRPGIEPRFALVGGERANRSATELLMCGNVPFPRAKPPHHMLTSLTSATYCALFIIWVLVQEGFDEMTGDVYTNTMPTCHVLVHTITNTWKSKIRRSHNPRQQWRCGEEGRIVQAWSRPSSWITSALAPPDAAPTSADSLIGDHSSLAERPTSDKHQVTNLSRGWEEGGVGRINVRGLPVSSSSAPTSLSPGRSLSPAGRRTRPRAGVNLVDSSPLTCAHNSMYADHAKKTERKIRTANQKPCSVSTSRRDRRTCEPGFTRSLPERHTSSGAAVVKWSDYSSPNQANRVRFPAGSLPEFLHVGILPDDGAARRVFSGLSRFPSPLHTGALPCSPRFTLIGSHDLDVKSRLNVITPPLSAGLPAAVWKVTMALIDDRRFNSLLVSDAILLERTAGVFGINDCFASLYSMILWRSGPGFDDRSTIHKPELQLMFTNRIVHRTQVLTWTLIVNVQLWSYIHILCNMPIPGKDIHGAAVAGRLPRSPPTKANRVQSPAGSPDFQVGIVPGDAVGRRVFSRGSHLPHPPPPALHSGAAPYSLSITLIGSQDLLDACFREYNAAAEARWKGTASVSGQLSDLHRVRGDVHKTPVETVHAEYTIVIHVDLEQDFQKCSVYREQPVRRYNRGLDMRVDQSRWLRATNLRVPTLSCFFANTSGNDVD
ncbi:hypothetical protein PR048_022813 [Dryococelus australis]|uniref:Uncharacterized protein n=1 Tax=Dryococelus australis TaxID=614101 RepID=A0ABQ9GSD7_9NEOP|nr:hypothetical protein PR048_022813 [Dryococelus australis]